MKQRPIEASQAPPIFDKVPLKDSRTGAVVALDRTGIANFVTLPRYVLVSMWR